MFYPLTRINENSNSHSLLFLSGSEQGTNNLGPVERWLLSTVAHIQLCCVVLCMWTLLLRCECHYVQRCGESIRCHDVVKYFLGSSSSSLLTLSGSSFPPYTHTHLTFCFFPADQSLSVLSALPYLVHLNVSYNKLTAILDFQPPKNLLVCTETAYTWECSIAMTSFSGYLCSFLGYLCS